MVDESPDFQQRHIQLEQELNRYRRMFAASRARHDEYEAIFNLLGDFGFGYRVEADGTFVREWLSASFVRVTGYEIADLDSRDDWYRLLHPADISRAEAFKQALLLGKDMLDEFRLVNRQGQIRWIRYMMHPVYDQAGEQVERVYGAGQDITDEKAIQGQQAQFITNAMHELSHPVSSILMRLYLMRKQPEKLDEHLDALQPVAAQIRRMIEDMRDVSYLDRSLVTLELRKLVLQDLIADVVRFREAEAVDRQIQIALELDPQPLTIHADNAQLARALENLVTNVIDLTPSNQTVTIRAFLAPPFYAVCEIEHLREEVEDEHPSVAFHPFSRPSQGRITHTGLELTITRRIIDLHGGDISLSINDEDCGIFTIRLKLAASADD